MNGLNVDKLNQNGKNSSLPSLFSAANEAVTSKDADCGVNASGLGWLSGFLCLKQALTLNQVVGSQELC
jgi:hypothetical protein